MSDHYLVESKVKVAERWRPIRGVAVGRMCIKVRELMKKEKMLEYQEKIRSEWERAEGTERWGGGGSRRRVGGPKEEGIRGRSRRMWVL